MKDETKAKEQLISELIELRRQVAELEALETEHKQAVEQLEERRRFIERVTSANPAVIYVFDLIKQQNIYASHSLANVLGLTPEELKAMGDNVLGLLIHPDDLGPFMKYLDTLSKDRDDKLYKYEYRMKHKSGDWVWLLNNDMIFTRDTEGKPLQTIGVALDITEHKQVEQALLESEQNFRSSLDNSPLGTRIINAEGETIYANRAILDIYGYSSIEELKSIPAVERHTPKSYAERQERVRKREAGKPVPDCFEQSIIRKDGEVRNLEVFNREVLWGGENQFQLIYHDITERKRAEEREKQLQKELNLASRLASVGELAAGVAHEINNPLTGVLAFSERLLRKSTDEKVSRDLKRVNDEARRAAKVVERLLTFARRREPEKENSDVNRILQETLELRAYELKTSNIEVETDLALGLPGIMADFHQLQEVFLNIIMNVEQAITGAVRGGKLGIKTREMKSCIRISFTDDGPGIPTEYLDRVFDPFFTTREKEGGTGLGLSVCHGIVQRHDGRIYARSKPGKGATFVVELPLTGEKIDKSKII